MKSQRFKFTPLDNRKLPARRNRKRSHGATGRNLTVRAPGGEPRRPGPRDPPTTSPAGRESSARPASRLLPSREGRLDEGNVRLASNRPDKGRRRAAPAPGDIHVQRALLDADDVASHVFDGVPKNLDPVEGTCWATPAGLTNVVVAATRWLRVDVLANLAPSTVKPETR